MLSLKDRLITQVSNELHIAEDLVDQVVTWAFKDAKEATQSLFEVEFSGLGKIMMSPYKLERTIKKFERILSLISQEANPKRYESIENELNRLYGVRENLGRMVQPSIPKKGNKRIYITDEQGPTGDL